MDQYDLHACMEVMWPESVCACEECDQWDWVNGSEELTQCNSSVNASNRKSPELDRKLPVLDMWFATLIGAFLVYNFLTAFPGCPLRPVWPVSPAGPIEPCTPWMKDKRQTPSSIITIPFLCMDTHTHSHTDRSTHTQHTQINRETQTDRHTHTHTHTQSCITDAKQKHIHTNINNGRHWFWYTASTNH